MRLYNQYHKLAKMKNVELSLLATTVMFVNSMTMTMKRSKFSIVMVAESVELVARKTFSTVILVAAV